MSTLGQKQTFACISSKQSLTPTCVRYFGVASAMKDPSMESKLKHLELIQGVINRMAGNSFLLKGWSVTLISALFALAAKDANLFFVYLSYFPSATFWALDGFFLRQERLYRELYKEVAGRPPNGIDFSMNAEKFEDNVDSCFSTCFSSTLRLFHGTVFGVIVLIMVIMATSGGK